MKPVLIAVLLVCCPGMAVARCHHVTLDEMKALPNSECEFHPASIDGKSPEYWECGDNPGECPGMTERRQQADHLTEEVLTLLRAKKTVGSQQGQSPIQQPPDEGWITVYGPLGPQTLYCDHVFGCREMMGVH